MVSSVAPALATSAQGEATSRSGRHFLVVFAVLASFMGTSVGMAQVSTSLYAVSLGASQAQLGLIAGAQSIGVVLVSLPIGMLVDRFGPARPFLAGTFLAGVTYALVPLFRSPSWLLACTALVSFFMPLRFVSLNTVFFSQLAALGESKAGFYRGTHMLGMFLVGPALGALVVSRLGFAVSYWLIAAAFLITLALAPIVFARYTLPPDGRPFDFWPRLRGQLDLMVRDRAIRNVSCVELSTQAAGAFFTFFVIVLAVKELKLSPNSASNLVGLKGSTYILALFVLGSLLKRLSKLGYSASFITIALGLGAVGLARELPLLWSGALLLGLGLGSVQIATLTQYARLGARTGHGRISGMSALVGPSGGVLGNLVGGSLAKWVGLSQVFLLLASGFAVAAWVSWRDARRPGRAALAE
ncbi:MAG TPA: MFS transporter [Polyangiaceae bacterium]|nr:MFS transporter [Polyangiaceae bacterium]